MTQDNRPIALSIDVKSELDARSTLIGLKVLFDNWERTYGPLPFDFSIKEKKGVVTAALRHEVDGLTMSQRLIGAMSFIAKADLLNVRS